MQWSEVVARPSDTKLRQFAGLWIVFFVGWAAWRAWHGHHGVEVQGLAAAGVIIGALGLAAPRGIRPIYTGWMIAAFPIGWTVSRAMLAALFYVVFTPVALVFKLMRRDALRVRRPPGVTTYWTARTERDIDDYFRQS